MYFGSVIPIKYPEGITEKVKLINTGKVFANVKFETLKKNGLFSFDVFPKTAWINPHESIYVWIIFKPEIMA